jgi:cytoskeletal protein RodZ
MNWTGCSRSKCFSTLMLAAAFLISSAMPSFATPPQSDHANTTNQKASNSLPDAPQPQQAQTPQQSSQASQQSSQTSSTQTPSGAAGAKAATPKGAPVAQTVGAAVAPAHQRGHRSLLIKVGLLAGAAVAVGTVVALSERSPTRPPGTASSTHQ